MLISKENAKLQMIENCHEGTGVIKCLEYLSEYKNSSTGVKFIHDNILVPGATIGEHEHHNDEEIYFIISGDGTMMVDGKIKAVSGGDVCVTRKGHSHSIRNSSDFEMRLLVIGINI